MGEVLEIIKIVGSISGILFPILLLLFSEKIKTKFKRQLQDDQNIFTEGLKKYESDFLLELEKKKLGFDILRATQIEINKNRLLFYENLISDFYDILIMMMAYSNNIETFSIEKLDVMNIQVIKKATKKSFYLTNPLTLKFYNKLIPEFGQILIDINTKEKLKEESIQKFTKSISNLRNQMMKELTEGELINGF